LLEFYFQTMKKYQNEFNRIYLLDSTWNIKGLPPEELKGRVTVMQVNPSLRYYDAYKGILPYVEEDQVLLLDNDMIINKAGVINTIFLHLDLYDVVSIYDTIGEKHFKELDNQSKFCPYLFATRTAVLRQYTASEWGPNMPVHETLGGLTEDMLRDGLKPFEMTEDKSSIYIDGTRSPTYGKDLGYYHIRAGSTIAYLLAEKTYGNKDTYLAYLHNQPKNEYARHCAWYRYMGGDPSPILTDAGILFSDWDNYYTKFLNYHRL